jgi:hypothetical protein
MKRSLLVLVLVCVACARNDFPPRPRNAPRVAPTPAREAPQAPNGASMPSRTGDPGGGGDGHPSSVERLKVDVIPLEEGGVTYHGVQELRLSVGTSAPLVLREPEDDEMPVPIPGPEHAIGTSHVLLLGWSSTGNGTLDLHALLLRLDPDGVVLEHNLKLTMLRSRAVLVLRRRDSDTMLLGIPDWRTGDGPGYFETSLVLGTGWQENLREVNAEDLQFVAPELRPADAYYPAYRPAIIELVRQHPEWRARTIPEVPAKVAWVEVTSDGFTWVRETR